MRARLVLLDRDGVLNPDVGHPHRLEDALLYPDVIPGLLQLQSMGFTLAVVSNQSGVGRGFYTLAEATHFNAAIAGQLRSAGVDIDVSHFFICPHTPAERCDCRKPRPGLLQRAAQVFDADLETAVIVGDARSDMAAGRAVGATTILLDRAGTRPACDADWVVQDLKQAAAIISGICARVQPIHSP